MPTPATSSLPRPKSWDEFEDIVWEIFIRKWQDPSAQRYGKSGQVQNGVDIYGRSSYSDQYVAVQCKRYEDKTLNKRKIEDELAKVEGFLSPISKYLIATTESRDTKLQDVVRELNERRKQENKFEINVVFWEDLCSSLADPNNRDLLQKYYGEWERIFIGQQSAKKEQNSVLRLSPPQPLLYRSETWVGRESLITDLLPKLQRQTRLLWITGISGIGKTALAECLAVRFQNPGVSFHRVSFDIEGQSQDFTTGAATILAELGETELDPQEQNNPQRMSDRLLQKLQHTPYWIQLDALERLLLKESAEFVDSHWLSFFQRCLNSSNLPSRLVLTTQTLPAGFEEFVDCNSWHEETLQGLPASERLELFARNGITIDETNRATIDRIGQIYEGHPLVLQVIAREMLAHPFNGNVAQYWGRYSNEFEQVARELQSQRVNPALYRRELQKRVRQRVEKSLKRLPTDALDLLCRASVYRRPVPETFWLALIDDRISKQPQEAYRTLGDRALVEKEGIHQGQFLIRQHNLIRSVAYDLLRQDSATWETAERRAAQQWLTVYQPAPAAPNLEKVRGYLEAFEHYCEVEDLEAAVRILETNDTPDRRSPLWLWLQLTGSYKEQIKLLNRISGKVSPKLRIRYLTSLGETYSLIGKIYKAIETYSNALSIIQDIQDSSEENKITLLLGNAYRAIYDFENAISCYKQVQQPTHNEEKLLIMSSLVAQQSISFNQVRSVYSDMLKSIVANKLNPESLEYVIRKYKEAVNLENNLKEFDYEIREIIKQYKQELNDKDLREDSKSSSNGSDWKEILDAFRRDGWHSEESNVLVIMGSLSKYEEEDFKAIEVFQSALEIMNSTERVDGKADVLKNLAELHQKTGEIKLAKEYCDRALALAIELGIPLAEECRSLQADLNQEMNHDSRETIKQEVAVMPLSEKRKL